MSVAGTEAVGRVAEMCHLAYLLRGVCTRAWRLEGLHVVLTRVEGVVRGSIIPIAVYLNMERNDK